MFMPSGTTGDVAARNGQERRAWQRDRSVEIVLPVRVIPVILLSHCLQSGVDFFSFSNLDLIRGGCYRFFKRIPPYEVVVC